MKDLSRNTRFFLLICLVGLLQACASTGPNYSEYLIGQWDTNINGFPVVVEYTEGTVGVVGFGEPVPYTLEANVISFEFQGTQTSTIEMVSDDEMKHTNVDTQAVTEFKRHP